MVNYVGHALGVAPDKRHPDQPVRAQKQHHNPSPASHSQTPPIVSEVAPDRAIGGTEVAPRELNPSLCSVRVEL